MSEDETKWNEAFANPGKTLRIRLPNDFVVKDTVNLVEPKINRIVTLKEFSETTLKDISYHFAAAAIYKEFMEPNALAAALMAGYKPPTKWQKRKHRIKEFLGRFKIAYRVMRGDDLNFED